MRIVFCIAKGGEFGKVGDKKDIVVGCYNEMKH